MKIGSKEFDTEHHTYVMGILNVTPDSFSDGGKYNQVDAAVFRAEQMIQEGADILDVGGESTRPGYTPVSEVEEIQRVVPVIQAIRNRFDIPISLDTYKSNVAEAGLLAGADMINDIWGLKGDEKMAALIAGHRAACCLMHNRNNTDYKDFWIDMMEDLKGSIQIAHRTGITDDQIILDPGVGFAKNQEQNLITIQNLEMLKDLGYPVLLGASRKSVIGSVLDVPSEERVTGTIVTTVFAAMQHCGFVRVHDIKENVQAIRMAEAILNAGM